MSKQVSRRRGSANQHQNFTGSAGEITVDTTNWRIVVHDNSTAGGITGVKRSDIWQTVDGFPDLLSPGGSAVFESHLNTTTIGASDGVGGSYEGITVSNNQVEIFNPSVGSFAMANTTTSELYDQAGTKTLQLRSGSIYPGSNTAAMVSNSPGGFLNLPTMSGNPANYNPNLLLGFAPVVFSTGSNRLCIFHPTGKWHYINTTSF